MAGRISRSSSKIPPLERIAPGFSRIDGAPIAACISWYGFTRLGLHPALGLLPIVPTVSHAARAFGVFSVAEQYLTDLLNMIEHALRHPDEIIPFFFGLCNAGVEFSSMGSATWVVLAGLLIGKPVGILLFG